MIATVMNRTLRRAALALALSATAFAAQASTLHVELDTVDSDVFGKVRG